MLAPHASAGVTVTRSEVILTSDFSCDSPGPSVYSGTVKVLPGHVVRRWRPRSAEALRLHRSLGLKDCARPLRGLGS